MSHRVRYDPASDAVLDFAADDLILAKYDSPSFYVFKQQVSNAAGIIVSTPVYKAAYTGSPKALGASDVLQGVYLVDQ